MLSETTFGPSLGPMAFRASLCGADASYALAARHALTTRMTRKEATLFDTVVPPRRAGV
jgi:hypothetical protein